MCKRISLTQAKKMVKEIKSAGKGVKRVENIYFDYLLLTAEYNSATLRLMRGEAKTFEPFTLRDSRRKIISNCKKELESALYTIERGYKNWKERGQNEIC